MKDKKNKADDHIGNIFKAYRQEKGLTREDVAHALCLDKNLVSSLEKGEFPEAVSPVYLKLYVRSYARFLGIDEAEAQTNFNNCYQSKPNKDSSHPEFHKEDVFLSPVPSSTRYWLHTLTVSILGFCALILWYHHITTKNGGEFWLFHSNQKTAAEVGVLKGIPIDVKKSVAANQSKDQNKVNTDKNSVAQQAENMPNLDTLDDQQQPTAEVENVNVIVSEFAKLEIEFNDDCWVSIKDADGKRLAIGLMKEGKQLSLHGKRPFKLVLGNAGAVHISLDGKEQDTARFRINEVAKFVVGKF